MADNVRKFKEDSKIQELVDGLNEDLANEYAATIMYTYNASVVTGLYRTVLKPFFEKEISDEIGHAQYLSDKIKTLGGTPTTTPTKVKQVTHVKEMLEQARDAERDTIKRYEQRKQQALGLGLTELVVKLEDMIADETNHKDELDRLLADPSFSK
ncbi:ferritin-like domain-containing protein [Aquibacillus salsiterrae]|uniref:Ferritin-like domain-containing protein n=1 Tax=Aquibacillus salsiterrae TaxID=2950439 RepID=A0A9X4AGM0_9BACI|nr:ferritin-like domain-containing protein [Aquibacillus salsiterrae]MDC3417263.1 ferritin-like domain-containing protein [Aquibacillus salsiterrae]